MMIRRLATAALSVLLLTVPLGATADASPHRAADPVVRHSGKNWVWFGPKSWDASYGVYGITVLGTRGATLDLGFSTTVCAQGSTYAQSVASYFAAKRREARQSFGWKITQASPIGHPAGTSTTYRRQVLQFTATNGGVTYQGVGTFDYDFSTSVDGVNYCYQRSLAKYSKQPAWKTMRPVLTKVEQSLAYSGPGAPGESPDDPQGD